MQETVIRSHSCVGLVGFIFTHTNFIWVGWRRFLIAEFNLWHHPPPSFLSQPEQCNLVFQTSDRICWGFHERLRGIKESFLFSKRQKAKSYSSTSPPMDQKTFLEKINLPSLRAIKSRWGKLMPASHTAAQQETRVSKWNKHTLRREQGSVQSWCTVMTADTVCH